MHQDEKFSPLASVALAREILAAYNLQAKKTFGQNFLINDQIVKKIIELSEVKTGDYVTEIGPGYGTLTVALVRSGARVLAVEKDKNLINALYDNLDRFCEEGKDNIKVLRCDALKINFDAYKHTLNDKPVKLISNLPYNIAAPVVITYFQKLENLNEATVMVQKEIAQRMMAKPGNKNYGAYTVKLAMYADCSDKFDVSPNNFMPAPRVDSTVIKLVRHNRVDSLLASKACLIADAAFSHRRKTISNSIKQFFCDDTIMIKKIKNALFLSNISEFERAENLCPSDYISIANNL